MHISPYYEGVPLAPASAAEIQEYRDVYEPEPGGSGEFARILEGMIRETRVDDTPEADSSAADNVLLAEDNELAIECEIDLAGFLPPELNETLLSGISHLHSGMNGDTSYQDTVPDEWDGIEFTELDQEVLSNAQMLLSQQEKAVDAGQDSALAKTRAGEGKGSLAEAGGELPAMKQPEADALSTEITSQAAQAAGDNQNNPEAGAEKKSPKNQIRPGEALPQSAQDSNTQNLSRAELAAAAPQNTEGKMGRQEDGRLDSRRGRERRYERTNVDVRDYRAVQAGNENKGSADLRVNAGLEKPLAGDPAIREISLELRLPDQGIKTQAMDGWGTKAAQSFENMLARELHQNFNNDIVRHASMILRDEGKGMIRLALKPDVLGNVKISLEMAENKITGHIVVESEEALKAFEKEIRSLEQAFKDSGFEDAFLEMSLASDGRDGNLPDQFQQWAQARALLTGTDTASRYDEQSQTESPSIRIFGPGQAAINLLA